MVYAHRAVWENANGPIPEGEVVHHICENKWCANLEHLELKTKRAHGLLHRRPVLVCPKCGSDERVPIRSRPGKTYCGPCARARESSRQRGGTVICPRCGKKRTVKFEKRSKICRSCSMKENWANAYGSARK